MTFLSFIKIIILFLSKYITFFRVQDFLKEEPYTAKEIEEIIGENLITSFSSNPAYLDVIKVAQQYKLHQVLFKTPLAKFLISHPICVIMSISESTQLVCQCFASATYSFKWY